MTTVEPRPHDEYTIGWVCALPKEQTAATAMLDEIHPAVQKPPNDPNYYTLGSIGNHNVIIACLPKGLIGTNSAATVATWMVSTFPRIKFGLMVGIGGGVPPKVRLGDVVVSTPVGRFPGVVQWDMGKAKENGSFEPTGSLDKPPTSLLAALSKLETEHEMAGTKIPEYLEALGKNWPKLKSKYLRSDSLKDVLFSADYGHVNESTADDKGEGENCGFCDKTRIVQREPRDARVHYGLIASGNQVIKDAIFRDKLKEKLEGDVLCVEMEAAGLMNNFPCVVIRGICDYADSHKNKDWQEHAAAMAAAFAKELLQYVQVEDVKKEPSVKDMLSHVHNIVSKTGADVEQIASIIERDEDLKILDWLTPRDYGYQQNKYIKTRQKGTGQWLLDSSKFMTWVETGKQILFCPGMPGAGKTILTAVVVDNLASQFAHDPSVGIAYIYFNFWQQGDHEEEDLFASLLKQLAQGLPSLPASVKDLYDHHKGKGTRPSSDKISKVLRSVIRVSYSRVFIIIDALDECQASDNCRTRFIEALFEFQKCGASIFATSRSIPEVTDKFDTSTWLEIRASNDDIGRYVDAQISQGDSATLRDMQAEASARIMTAADGMFLLAKLGLDSLLDAKLPKDIRNKLKTLPKAYSDAYQGIMKRIEHQGPESVKFAKTVLSWITCAKRPLTIPELRHALAVEVGGSGLDQRDLPQVQDLISVCAGLVTVDQGSDIIRLFHYTAQEYFQQTQKQWFPDAGDDITRTCVTYLSFDDFEAGFCATDAEFEERLRSHQLYDYAAHKWGHHAGETTSLDPLVLGFLQYQAKVEASSQALFAVKESGQPHYSQNVPKQPVGLHLAAYFGIEKAVRIPLDSHGWDPEDGYNRTPLSWAAENGHEAVVRLLLSKGANPKTMDHSGLTPFSWATRNGHEAIARLLNANINVKSANTDGAVGHSPSTGDVDPEETRTTDRSKEQSHQMPPNQPAKPPQAKTEIKHVYMAVMGVTGAGKSSFISLCTGKSVKIGHDLKSCTADVEDIEFMFNDRLCVHLIDTPGFDNTNRSDAQVLQDIAYWLSKSFEEGTELSGIIYLHRIIDVRMSGSTLRNLSMFKKLCGGKVYSSVVLATTMWALIDEATGAQREQQLTTTKEFWGYMHDKGSHIFRLAQARESCLSIIQHVLSFDSTIVLGLQDEMVNQGRQIEDTKAGVQFNKDIIRERKKHQAELQDLKVKHDAELQRVLKEECDKLEETIRLSNEEQTKLKQHLKHIHKRKLLELKEQMEADRNKYEDDMEELSRNLEEALEWQAREHDEREIDTRLHFAARNGKTGATKKLLKQGAKLEAKDSNGGTPLHDAALDGDAKMVKLLLKQGAKTKAKDDNGNTPLHHAAWKGKTDIVILLLEHGANIEAKDNNGHTPLHDTVDTGKKYMARLLLRQRADIEAEDDNGDTPLHNAARSGKVDMVEFLLNQGANIEAKRNNGRTPFFLAIWNGHEDIAELLLDREADIDAEQNDMGDGPLHLAAWNGKADMVEYLLDHGANIEAEKNSGDRPLQLAIKNGKADVTELLRDRGASEA